MKTSLLAMLGMFCCLTVCVDSFGKENAVKETQATEPTDEMTAQMRKEMAAAHRRMADCLEQPNKSFDECRREMGKEMKEVSPYCPMVRSHRGYHCPHHGSDD